MNVLMLVVVPVIILAIVAALVIAQYDISKNNRRGKLVIPILSLVIPIALLIIFILIYKISGVVIMKSSMLLISVLLFIGVQVAIIGFIIEMVFRSTEKNLVYKRSSSAMEKVTDTIINVGVNDYDIILFESQYMLEKGMAYNSYVILDDKVAVMDTVDSDVTDEWLKN